jgi:hypothetical protein
MFKRRTCMQTPARRNVRGDEMGSNSRETRAMRIVRIPSNKVEGPISDYHVLTYADSGFGPLPHYTRRRVPRDQVEAIVSRINQRDEAATFFPLPLSAVPRKVIWDKRHWAELRAHLADFFHVNARTFGARRILVDLRGGPPGRNDPDFERATEAWRRQLATELERVAILVRTAAGKLHVQRLGREVGRAPGVFMDEAEAVAWLRRP